MTLPSSTRSESTSPRLVIEVRSAPAPVKHFDWWTLAPTAVTVAAAFVGWWVVERFARQRERRNDLRDMVKGFGSTIDEIVTSAIAFYRLHGSTAEARALAETLRANIGSLHPIMKTMREAGLELQADDQYRQFRQAITGGDFDRMAREPSPSNAAIYTLIPNAGRALSRSAQLAFYETFVRRARARDSNRVWRWATGRPTKPGG